jgi:hypothetical protein
MVANRQVYLEVPPLERYFVLMDGSFAEWYLGTILSGPSLSNHNHNYNNDMGIDNTSKARGAKRRNPIWKRVFAAKRRRMKNRRRRSVSCLLVLVTRVKETTFGAPRVLAKRMIYEMTMDETKRNETRRTTSRWK